MDISLRREEIYGILKKPLAPKGCIVVRVHPMQEGRVAARPLCQRIFYLCLLFTRNLGIVAKKAGAEVLKFLCCNFIRLWYNSKALFSITYLSHMRPWLNG